MKLLSCFLTNNDCYKTKETIVPQGVMIHSTGANNPWLKRYVQPSADDANYTSLMQQLGTNSNLNSWNRANVNACVHGFIGKLADGSIAVAQTLPWTHRGWHSASGKKGSANNTHISFEICEDGLSDPNYFAQVYQVAVELTAYLCNKYGLDPLQDGVVICHAEGYRRGIASNHGDVNHWFPKHGKNMNVFRQDVASAMKEKQVAVETDSGVSRYMPTLYAQYEDIPSWAKPTIKKMMDKNILQGDGKGLNIDETFVKLCVIMDRLNLI